MIAEPSVGVTEITDIERICRDQFATDIVIKQAIISDLTVEETARMTVFETDRKELYALCQSTQPLTLASIRRIVRGMGAKAEVYIPPDRDQNHFIDYGRKVFASVFPGRKLNSNDDISYYISQCPYSPALIKIARIDGEIREYIPIIEQWKKVLEYSYNRIKVY
jgi:hypothetical protein